MKWEMKSKDDRKENRIKSVRGEGKNMKIKDRKKTGSIRSITGNTRKKTEKGNECKRTD